ncbi:hypothetical protein C3F09_00290 [candidate division GN15 bacterium]|uniref:DUF2723 domain-containing protein n=1 Tax=candidate division GN15 bacterium TaxID=2072418 RepID=A0A855X5M2_9BACT|nr:MAG: hypothetical protein C3F09_00290 [candidate division GN15 bacterium]
MFKNWFRQIDPINALVALGVWLTVFIVYLLTQAVTLTFWDCGEFIACCHILGIPHPPGTPLYVLVGRLFAILPIFADAAARINFLSVVSSSLTALFAYLCAVRVLRLMNAGTLTTFRRALVYAGAACGAFFLAFGKTQWGNSIEAEVYGLSMLIFFVMLWLTLIYASRAASDSGHRLMLTVVYLGFLGIGVHMTTFLALPICALFFILKRDTPPRGWLLVAGALLFDLYLIFALSSRPGEVPFYVPVLVVFVIYLFYLFSIEKLPPLLLWFVLGYLMTVAPVLGLVYRAMTHAEPAPVSPVLSAVSIAGAVGLVLLAIFSFYKARLVSPSGKTERDPILVSSLLVGVAGVAVVIPLLRIHGYAMFLLFSAVLLLSLGFSLAKYIRWPILIAIAGASTVMIGVFPFLYALAAVLAVSLIMLAVTRNREWRIALLILLVAVLGYSVHLFLPIRSAQKPMLDHSSLSSGLGVTADFLDRKQYTSQSMMERMFVRRAEWTNQFGDYQRMGFWRFFSDQYGLIGPRFMVLFLLGVLGLWETIRRAPQVGLVLTLLAIIGSIGLVLYMNFADGTRQNPVTGQDYIEVRDRDYFFTPAFLMFGLAIGMGVVALITFAQEALAKLSTGFRKIVLACCLLLFLLPIYALAGNYFESDRSRNYVAYDYAANILDSADLNAVLYTYGDNDTFPLWCLQEAFGFRKDVRVVNISLASQRWYVKQVQDYMGVNLGMSNAQIDQMRTYRTGDGRVMTISDQVIDAIADHNANSRPIDFSVTVPPSHRSYHGASIDQRLTLNGLAWRVRSSTGGMEVAVDDCYRRFLDPSKFRVRGLVDSTVYKDGNMLRMVTAYADAMTITADSLRKAGRIEDAERLARYAFDNLPPDGQVSALLATIYSEKGDIAGLEAILPRTEGDTRKLLTVELARARIKAGQKAEAEALLNQIVLTSPKFRPAFQELAKLYNDNLQYSNLRTLFTFWLKENPNDGEVRRLAQELDRVVKQRGMTDSVKK